MHIRSALALLSAFGPLSIILLHNICLNHGLHARIVCVCVCICGSALAYCFQHLGYQAYLKHGLCKLVVREFRYIVPSLCFWAI